MPMITGGLGKAAGRPRGPPQVFAGLAALPSAARIASPPGLRRFQIGAASRLAETAPKNERSVAKNWWL